MTVSEEREMFDIAVRNRFTGRVLERHSNKSLNFLFETQDVYMLAFWIKVTAIEVRDKDVIRER